MTIFKQVPSGSLVGDYRPVALLRCLPTELSKRYAIEWTHGVEDGLGEVVGACFTASNGQHFVLEHYPKSPEPGKRCTSVLTLHQSVSAAEALDAVLGDLKMTSEDVEWLREDLRFVPHALIRQDDHGNRFCVGTYLCRADALAAWRTLARGQHKQEYWTEARPGDPPA